MKQLDQKITKHFEGLVVRKDLVKAVKGNAIVPSFVLEFLLGQYCATSDDNSIETGIETVKEILTKHYVHRNEAGLIQSTIREKRRHKVIDRISVALNDKKDVYEATFANLGISKVIVDSETIKKHPKLLVSGVWCLADVEYEHAEGVDIPWLLDSIKPIQLSHFDFDAYVAAREEFTTEEWIDLLMQSIGFDPSTFNRRKKLLQLIRLIPFCERNYNLIELGPKGTGKSHIYSEFSPHGMLISGGEITVPKLFVENRKPYKIGLVGYWDCVAFDEFAGKKKRVDKALVDIMKNYMANKSFSRGIETLGAEASMVFVGNTQHTVEHMLRHTDLFDELPDKYHDSAFLDRLHFYIPGWEVDIIRGEMFSSDFGFVVDYFAEVLRSQRDFDFSREYAPHFSLSEDISTRDRDGIHKTFSGLMKILYPHRKATIDEIEEILKLAIQGRKRIKDQLMRFDSTYEDVDFSYYDNSGNKNSVVVAEELEFPKAYQGGGQATTDENGESVPSDEPVDDEADGPVDVQTNVFEGFKILEQFDTAGMAEVYRVCKIDDNKDLFLKRVRIKSSDEEALEREVGIYNKLAQLDLRHVLQILEFVRGEDYVAIITEYADRGDLQNHAVELRHNNVSVDEAKEIGLAIAAGVKELHDHEIVHRDLKPRNILNFAGIWKLADFGISKNRDRLITQKTFQQHGTLGYTAPEQFDGVEAMPSADIYSLGKILVFLLTGNTDVDQVSYPSWRPLIQQCVHTQPDNRPSIDELMTSLSAIQT